MKVMILTDLEGPSGVNGRPDSIGNTMPNRTTAEIALVNEINACCEGLIAAGADEILVLDGHGGSNSIDIFKLHPKAKLIQIGNWMPATCLDSTFDAFVQLGAHGMQSSGGYMCHTYDSHHVSRMLLNGKSIGEIGICSLQAAYFHIPTILVSGDETACREAEEFLGKNVVTVPTKFDINRYTAVNYPPQEVYAELRKQSEKALKNLKNAPCPELPEHCELIVKVMCPNDANLPEKSGIERLDETTLRYVSDDFLDIWAQRCGWAPGVHKKKYGITPQWVHPYGECGNNRGGF